MKYKMPGTGMLRRAGYDALAPTLFMLAACVTASAQTPPANDAFASATPVFATVFLDASADNVDATGEIGEPDHASSSAPLASIWFAYETPVSGEVLVDTSGSAIDTTLAVYTGAAVDSLTLVAENDDATGTDTGHSEVFFQATPGTTYYIAVDGFGSEQGLIEFFLIINPDDQNPPPNDDFANAAALTSNSGTATGLNIFATGETGEDNHAGTGAPNESAWLRWTAPSDGLMTMDTLGSDFDTVLAVYTGTFEPAIPANNLTEVAANDDVAADPVTVDDRTSHAQFAVTGGETYHIAVDSFGQAENLPEGEFPDSFTGYYELNYEFMAAPIITAQPQDTTVAETMDTALSVTATSDTPLALQWQKQPPGSGAWADLTGETGAELLLPTAVLADDGALFRCVLVNDGGTVLSDTVTLTVLPAAGFGLSAGQSGSAYTPGATVTITNTIGYGSVDDLAFQAVIPDGWQLTGETSTRTSSKPAPGAQGALDWHWSNAPRSPFSFSYTLQTDAVAGPRPVSATLTGLDSGGNALAINADPQPLVFLSDGFHDADANLDSHLDLAETLSLLTLYNYRDGAARTGEYHHDGNNFAPGPGTLPAFHNADYDQDGAISLHEALRTVGLHNFREADVRTGEYHADGTTVDGFAAGPQSAPAVPAPITASADISADATAYAGATGALRLDAVLTHDTLPTGLALQVVLPPGWTFVGDDATDAAAAPITGQAGTLEWLWTDTPASPRRFRIDVQYSTALAGTQAFASGFTLTDAAATLQPLPLADVTLIPGTDFATWAADNGIPGASPGGTDTLPGLSNIEAFLYNAANAGPGENQRRPYAAYAADAFSPDGAPDLLLYFYRNRNAANVGIGLESSDNLSAWNPEDAHLLKVQDIDADTELWCAPVDLLPGTPLKFSRLRFTIP